MATKSTRRPAKKATTTKSKNDTTLDVSFEEDIPKISREGAGSRRSKYDDLLDKVREKAEKDATKSVAVLQFDSTGKATSRYTSIRDAASKREDAAHWTIATRSFDENDVRLYVKWNSEPQDTEDESDD